MLRTKRGRCEAPELRPKDHSSALTSLCFHCAFGFSQPNGSRTCKTPWSVFQDGSEGPPTYSQQRCGPCQKDTLYKRPLQYPSGPEPGMRGSKLGLKLHPQPRSGPNGSLREAPTECKRQPAPPKSEVFADHQPPGSPAATMNRQRRLREPLRLLLHSFTYF